MTKQAYFVTGTDTGVGKTLIASALVYGFAQAGYKSMGMKPVAAGFELVNAVLANEDVLALVSASNVASPASLVNPYGFEAPIAPHIAAELTGQNIELAPIIEAFRQLQVMSDVVIVEGAGGFFVPLNATETTADLVQHLDISVILVVGMRLGCLNHALLTQEAILSRGLKLAGWVANVVDPHMAYLEENIECLRARIQAPCLGVVPWLEVGSQSEQGYQLAADLLYLPLTKA